MVFARLACCGRLHRQPWHTHTLCPLSFGFSAANERPIPYYPNRVNVKDFGAVGNGVAGPGPGPTSQSSLACHAHSACQSIVEAPCLYGSDPLTTYQITSTSYS